MEMITLIFLLLVSFNGAFNYLDDVDISRIDLVSKPTTELVSAWGAPDNVVVATDIGLVSSQFDEVEIWSYYNPVRSVSVRDNVVLSIRWG